MRRAALTLLLAATACTGNAPAPRAPEIRTGGTLRVVLSMDPAQQLDPQKEYEDSAWELFRCCLLRTLMSYNGKETAEGGSIPRPDLAGAPPVVSADGLMWTFRIRSGIHYAPPFEDTEITARDFVTALKRTLRVGVKGRNAPGTYGTTAFYFIDTIEGARQFAVGEAAGISGLETPDDHTLVVHLTRPTGDLDFRFAMPTTAPIPPLPTDPQAPFGAATGHLDGYGGFLVASGPYAIAGSEALDFSLPPAEQLPVAGYVPGDSITFVRNPSWDRQTDPLRAALPDRIWFSIRAPLADPAPTAEFYRAMGQLSDDLDAARVDVALLPPQVDQLDRYLGDADLHARVHRAASSGAVFYLAMNLAVPPFDDVHVRRAVSYAIDKTGLLDAWESLRGPRAPALTEDPATHIAPDGLEHDILSSWDPYPAPGHGGDIDLARREMAQSRYDRDGDGACDATVCRNVSAAGLTCTGPILLSNAPTGQIVRHDLSQIGIVFAPDPTTCPDPAVLPSAGLDPRAHVPITSDWWGPDYPDAAQFLQQLFSLSGEGTSPIALPVFYYSMVGASPAQLRRWGYPVTHVQGVDDRIARCSALAFEPRVECWAEPRPVSHDGGRPLGPVHGRREHVDRLVARRRVLRRSGLRPAGARPDRTRAVAGVRLHVPDGWSSSPSA